jgi:hypothetical protein
MGGGGIFAEEFGIERGRSFEEIGKDAGAVEEAVGASGDAGDAYEAFQLKTEDATPS